MRVRELLLDGFWRAFDLGPGLTSGEGDQGPIYYPPPPPPPLQANPGPPPRGGISGSRSQSGGAATLPAKTAVPDIFAGYLGPEIDAAKQIVQQWMALMGYPHGMDANQLTLEILRQQLTGDSAAADRWLFDNAANDGQRQGHEGAQFGLDPTTFLQRKQGIDSLFQSLIGQDPQQLRDQGQSGDAQSQALQSLYYQALANNWNQTQVLQSLQGTGFADLAQAQPWLLQGQGYQQASQTYASLYGTVPVDTATLASWFKFNQGAQQLGRSSREAVETVGSLVQGGTESR